MKKTLLLFYLVLFSSLGFSQVLYPEVYSCFGGHSTGTNIQLTWTAGEPLYETATNENSILTQGFNQVRTIISTDIQPDPVNEEIQIYPNPCKDKIWITYSFTNENRTLLKIFDISGSLLDVKQLESGKKEINIEGLPSGIYIIKVLNAQGKTVKTDKIVKTK